MIVTGGERNGPQPNTRSDDDDDDDKENVVRNNDIK